jgi:hypothetical protein
MSVSSSRDDFPEPTKRALAARVNDRCSNPDCGAQTSGPQVEPAKALNVGVAAHITAAAPRGPRYDATLMPEERADIANGVWLCQTCAKLVDNDPPRFNAAVLRDWKTKAEQQALDLVGKTAPKHDLPATLIDKWGEPVVSREGWHQPGSEERGVRATLDHRKRREREGRPARLGARPSRPGRWREG